MTTAAIHSKKGPLEIFDHPVKAETTKAVRIAVDGHHLFAIDPAHKTKFHQKKLGEAGIKATYQLAGAYHAITTLTAAHGLVAAVGHNGAFDKSPYGQVGDKVSANHLSLWNGGNTTPVHQWEMLSKFGPRVHPTLNFTPKKQLLMTKSGEKEEGFLLFFDLSTFQMQKWNGLPATEDRGVAHVVFNGEETFFASNSDVVYLCDLRLNQAVKQFPAEAGTSITEISAQNESLFTGGIRHNTAGLLKNNESFFVNLWDIRFASLIFSEKINEGVPQFIRPCGNSLLVGTEWGFIHSYSLMLNKTATRKFDNVGSWFFADIRESEATLLGAEKTCSVSENHSVMHFTSKTSPSNTDSKTKK